MSHFPEELCARVCASVRTRASATSRDRDRWADSHWLHVFALRQNALPRGLDLHATEGGRSLPAAAGLVVQNPSLLFPRKWHAGVTAAVHGGGEERNEEVQSVPLLGR